MPRRERLNKRRDRRLTREQRYALDLADTEAAMAYHFDDSVEAAREAWADVRRAMLRGAVLLHRPAAFWFFDVGGDLAVRPHPSDYRICVEDRDLALERIGRWQDDYRAHDRRRRRFLAAGGHLRSDEVEYLRARAAAPVPGGPGGLDEAEAAELLRLAEEAPRAPA